MSSLLSYEELEEENKRLQQIIDDYENRTFCCWLENPEEIIIVKDDYKKVYKLQQSRNEDDTKDQPLRNFLFIGFSTMDTFSNIFNSTEEFESYLNGEST